MLKIAADFRGGSIEFEDLVQIGHLGLAKASRSFDPDRGKFEDYAPGKIRLEIFNATQSARSHFYPKETDGMREPTGGDSIERVFEWDSWGEFGSAAAICDRWTKLESSPEELSLLFEEIEGKRVKFAAAFISLSGLQRELVNKVYLGEPNMPIVQAARDLGISYYRAIRTLKKALKLMREVIGRMEMNSGGNIANGHPSALGLHGCVPGTVAA